MNILYISHEKDLNGASMSLLGIIDELIEDNNIFVLSSYKEGQFIEELKKRNVNIISSKYTRIMITKPKSKVKWIIKRIWNLIKSQQNYFSTLKLKEIIKNNKIDIIHTNTSVLDMGLLISKKFNIPHVLHIREFGKEDFNLYNIYSEKYYFKKINKNSNAIVTVSQAVFDKYKRNIEEKKMHVIYNGINDKNLQEKNFSSQKESFEILITGRIEEAKGQKEAILALNELVKKGYNNIILSIAGTGDVDEIKNMVEKLYISKNVRFLGKVNNLYEIRKNIDLELVCSRCEAFGRVTIEAMMSMIAVIGASTGGTKELIQDEYNGLLYKHGDFKDLADKILELYNNREKIIEIGENAFIYSKQFTAKRNAEKVYELYNSIISKEE